MDYTRHVSSPLGGITLASDGEALTGLWFDAQRHFAAALAPAHEERDLPVFALTERWLALYFSGVEPDFTPPLRPRGTDFRLAVWTLLSRIPRGKTTTYGRLAAALAAQTGRRVSARAVGGAVGHNPISLLIPCHRVLGASGALCGYAGGVERKRYLLALEGAAPPSALEKTTNGKEVV